MPAAPAESRCGWCGAAVDDDAERRKRRVLCAACGAWSIDPMPTEDELEESYGDWYRPVDGRFSGFGDALLRYLRGRLAARLDRISPAGPVLDVGSGDGALVDALSARERKAIGIERHSSHPAVREEEVGEVAGSWAAVVFWHSLEHLPRSGEALDSCASLLEPGGVLAIAMPNPDSIQAAVFGDRWFALDVPRHLVHVPARSLLVRLRGLGLSVERVSHLRGGQMVFGWLHGWIGCLPGHPDLYDAIRRSRARQRPIPIGTRVLAIVLAVALLPFAAAASLLEAALCRGGSIYVEARRV